MSDKKFQTAISKCYQFIPFDADDIKQIIDGRKTQHRLILANDILKNRLCVGFACVQTDISMMNTDSPVVLEIKAIRKQRLHDITIQDARAEGYDDGGVSECLKDFYTYYNQQSAHNEKIDGQPNPNTLVIEFDVVAVKGGEASE